VSFIFNPEQLVMLKIKRIIKNYLLVNFASLNLSITDANQFTVTSYGTLKIRLLNCIPATRVGGKLPYHTVLLKKQCVSNFNHSFIKTLQEALVQQFKFECNSSR
jgi:hypothetical protein